MAVPTANAESIRGSARSARRRTYSSASRRSRRRRSRASSHSCVPRNSATCQRASASGNTIADRATRIPFTGCSPPRHLHENLALVVARKTIEQQSDVLVVDDILRERFSRRLIQRRPLVVFGLPLAAEPAKPGCPRPEPDDLAIQGTHTHRAVGLRRHVDVCHPVFSHRGKPERRSAGSPDRSSRWFGPTERARPGAAVSTSGCGHCSSR